MTPRGAIMTCLRKYVTFSGRASRPEYWFFFLFVVVAVILAGVIDSIFFGAAQARVTPGGISARSGGPVTALVSLGAVLPLISAGCRRMHDSGRTALHLFYPMIATVGFIGFFGASFNFAAMSDAGALMAPLFAVSMIVLGLSPLIVIFWLTRPGNPQPNKYGPPPSDMAG